MISLRRASAISLRQFYLIKGSPARVVPLFVWVAIDIVLWGFITKYLNSVSAGGMNFIPSLLGAVLLWDFFARVMFGVTTAFFEDVWSRNFLNFFATPLSITEYLVGLVGTSIVTSAIGLTVMLIMASALFGLSFFTFGLAFGAFLFVLLLFGIALGILGTAIVLRLGPASEWFIWPIPAVVAPFAGVFYPVTTLPLWMQWLAKVLPPSYVFEGMRTLVAGGTLAQESLAIGATLAVLDVLLACWIFKYVYGYAVRTGLLARYSAESVS